MQYLRSRPILSYSSTVCFNNSAASSDSVNDDLASCHPVIASEWNYQKNKTFLPSEVTYGRSKRVWWICKEGHEWETRIYNRTIRKQGCPICAIENKKTQIDKNRV